MTTHSQKNSELTSLADAILTLKNQEDVARFLGDLCTPTELEALQERWSICQLLAKGYSYRDIQNQTGASTTTVGRVQRFMTSEPFKGYTLALERLGIHLTEVKNEGGRPKAGKERHLHSPKPATIEDQIIALYEQGMNPVTITRELHIDAVTVGKTIARNGLSKRQRPS